MSKPSVKSRITRGRRARHRRQEGVALLIIMIIIVITTAAAAASVRNTTAEMQAAGRERLLIQARYASEAAMVSSIAYFDQISQNDRFYLETWQRWLNESEPPETRAFTGGHQITTANRYDAVRITQVQQAQWQGGPLIEPVSGPDPGAAIPDYTGSFGPNQPFTMEPYIADITDCALAPPTNDPGSQQNQGSTGKTRKIDCTLTLRGRVAILDAAGEHAGVALSWDFPGGLNGQSQDRSGAGVDMRATIKTPPMLVPSGE
jgi:hypothetical protein